MGGRLLLVALLIALSSLVQSAPLLPDLDHGQTTTDSGQEVSAPTLASMDMTMETDTDHEKSEFGEELIAAKDEASEKTNNFSATNDLSTKSLQLKPDETDTSLDKFLGQRQNGELTEKAHKHEDNSSERVTEDFFKTATTTENGGLEELNNRDITPEELQTATENSTEDETTQVPIQDQEDRNEDKLLEEGTAIKLVVVKENQMKTYDTRTFKQASASKDSAFKVEAVGNGDNSSFAVEPKDLNFDTRESTTGTSTITLTDIPTGRTKAPDEPLTEDAEKPIEVSVEESNMAVNDYLLQASTQELISIKADEIEANKAQPSKEETSTDRPEISKTKTQRPFEMEQKETVATNSDINSKDTAKMNTIGIKLENVSASSEYSSVASTNSDPVEIKTEVVATTSDSSLVQTANKIPVVVKMEDTPAISDNSSVGATNIDHVQFEMDDIAAISDILSVEGTNINPVQVMLDAIAAFSVNSSVEPTYITVVETKTKEDVTPSDNSSVEATNIGPFEVEMEHIVAISDNSSVEPRNVDADDAETEELATTSDNPSAEATNMDPVEVKMEDIAATSGNSSVEPTNIDIVEAETEEVVTTSDNLSVEATNMDPVEVKMEDVLATSDNSSVEPTYIAVVETKTKEDVTPSDNSSVEATNIGPFEVEMEHIVAISDNSSVKPRNVDADDAETEELATISDNSSAEATNMDPVEVKMEDVVATLDNSSVEPTKIDVVEAETEEVVTTSDNLSVEATNMDPVDVKIEDVVATSDNSSVEPTNIDVVEADTEEVVTTSNSSSGEATNMVPVEDKSEDIATTTDHSSEEATNTNPVEAKMQDTAAILDNSSVEATSFDPVKVKMHNIVAFSDYLPEEPTDIDFVKTRSEGIATASDKSSVDASYMDRVGVKQAAIGTSSDMPIRPIMCEMGCVLTVGDNVIDIKTGGPELIEVKTSEDDPSLNSVMISETESREQSEVEPTLVSAQGLAKLEASAVGETPVSSSSAGFVNTTVVNIPKAFAPTEPTLVDKVGGESGNFKSPDENDFEPFRAPENEFIEDENDTELKETSGDANTSDDKEDLEAMGEDSQSATDTPDGESTVVKVTVVLADKPEGTESEDKDPKGSGRGRVGTSSRRPLKQPRLTAKAHPDKQPSHNNSNESSGKNKHGDHDNVEHMPRQTISPKNRKFARGDVATNTLSGEVNEEPKWSRSHRVHPNRGDVKINQVDNKQGIENTDKKIQREGKDEFIEYDKQTQWRNSSDDRVHKPRLMHPTN